MTPYIALPYRQRTPAWVEARKRLGITASEAAAACGVGKYGSPFDVFGWHRGLRADLIPTEEMEWGTILEDPVAKYAAKKLGIKIRRVNSLLQSTLYPYLLCSLDRWGDDGNLLEIKTTNQFAKDWGEAGTDQIPPDCMIQVTVQMIVTGARGAHVGVLFGGQHFRLYFVPWDEELAGHVITLTADLWDRIQRNDPPPIDASEGASAYLSARYAKANGATVDLSADVRDLAFGYLSANEEFKALEERKNLLHNQLVSWMGDNSQGNGGDVKITLFEQAGSTYTVTRKPGRTLRVTALET